MDEATLETHKKALIGLIQEQDSRITNRSNRYWGEIDRGNFQFDTREQLVAAIQAIDLEAIQASYLQDIIRQPRQLTIMAVSNVGDAATVSDDYTPIGSDELSQLVGD